MLSNPSLGSGAWANAFKNGIIPCCIVTRCGNIVKSVGASSSKKLKIPSPTLFIIECISSGIDDNGIVAKSVINGVIPAFISTKLGNIVKSVDASSSKK